MLLPIDIFTSYEKCKKYKVFKAGNLKFVPNYGTFYDLLTNWSICRKDCLEIIFAKNVMKLYMFFVK